MADYRFDLAGTPSIVTIAQTQSIWGRVAGASPDSPRRVPASRARCRGVAGDVQTLARPRRQVSASVRLVLPPLLHERQRGGARQQFPEDHGEPQESWVEHRSNYGIRPSERRPDRPGDS